MVGKGAEGQRRSVTGSRQERRRRCRGRTGKEEEGEGRSLGRLDIKQDSPSNSVQFEAIICARI